MTKKLNLYKKLIHQFSQMKILVIGDLMVDRFIRGKVSRISPEAPVPVVLVKDEVNLPGGSGNVVMNIASLGARVSCAGVIGEDLPGDHLLEHFQQAGIETDGIWRDPTLSTILKSRVIAEHQQVVRFDHENQKSLSHPVHTEIKNALPEMIRQTDAVILSDYGKGLITQPLLTLAIGAAKKFKKPICVDPKLEHFLLYQNVTCITPNLSEALGGMHRLKLDPQDGVKKLGQDILKALRCKSALITQGEGGMTLFEKNRITHIPTKAREVFDVTGAGDTVISVLTLSLACGASFFEAATLANLAAGIVVGKLGTATVSPLELKEALKYL